LALEFVQGRLESGRVRFQILALRSRRQGNPEVGFETLGTIPGNPAAVAQHGHHADRRLVILFLAGFGRSFGRVHVPAQIASQLFQLVNRRGQRRLPFDPHQHPRIALHVNFAAALHILMPRIG
jgi:hypothetical protein